MCTEYHLLPVVVGRKMEVQDMSSMGIAIYDVVG